MPSRSFCFAASARPVPPAVRLLRRTLRALLAGLGFGVVLAHAEPAALTTARLDWQAAPPPPAVSGTPTAVVSAGQWVLVADDAIHWTPAGGARPWLRQPLADAPRPGAAAAAWAGGFVQIGGDTAGTVNAWTRRGDTWQREALPPLAVPVASAAVGVAGGRLWVVGGIDSEGAPVPAVQAFTAAAGWQLLPVTGEVAPSAAELASPVVATRWDDLAYREALLVFTTHTVWRFTPGLESPWVPQAALPRDWQPTSAVPIGTTHVLLTGADGRVFAYHTITRTFVAWPAADVGTNARLAGDAAGLWAVADDGLRTGRIVAASRRLPALDWVVIGLYLAGMLWIGSWFSREEKGTSGYFLGSRRIPWWAAGLSIWATGVSAISFMAIPGKTYATNWHRIAEPIGNVFVLIAGAYLFIPVLRRLNLTTVMEHTEMRFHPSLRLVSTAFMVVSQIGGRMATTLLLPSMALSAATGIETTTSIIVMGIVTTVYTALGGFKAVIWTDVTQTILMLGGGLLTLVLIVLKVPDGLAGVARITADYDKLRPFDWTPDLTTATVYVFGLWAVGQLLGGVGQEFAQRAFATESVRAARRSMITAAVVSIPGTIIFFTTGTALFAYYHSRPDQLHPLLGNDNIVPLFIVQQIPVGLAGLLIAGIFAAAMSTLSGMNSVATVIVQDFYRFTGRDTPEDRRVRLARIVTCVAGALSTLVSLYLASLPIASLWDNFSRLMALLGGGMAGVGALGLLTTRANTFGVYVSIVTGTAWVAFAALGTRLHFMIYGVTTLAVCFISGYIASLAYTAFTGRPRRDLDGLTVWTTHKGADE